MISVLLPTRGRPGLAAEAIASLRDLAAGDVEVLLRIDDDDMYARTYRALLTDIEHVWIAIGPRLGYRRLHEYVNELAGIAEGTHLLLWNDDALMQTAGWDDVVRESLPCDRPCVGSLTPLETEGNVFPVLSRAFYDALAHFSLSPHNDTWVERVALEAGCHVDLSDRVTVEHLHGTIDDETRRGVLAAVAETSPEFFTPEMQYRRQCDIATIRKALAA